jgi:hypothetical protein
MAQGAHSFCGEIRRDISGTPHLTSGAEQRNNNQSTDQEGRERFSVFRPLVRESHQVPVTANRPRRTCANCGTKLP